MKNIFFALLLAASSASFGQVKISASTSGSNPAPSAMLEVESTNKGLLLPRMTTAERTSITSPAAGLTIYNTTLDCIEYYDGTDWKSLCVGAAQARQLRKQAMTDLRRKNIRF